MSKIDLAIRVYGWYFTQIEEDPPWSYTIGLLQSWNHPELVVMDLDHEPAAALLRWAVALIERHGRLEPAELAALGIEIVEVAAEHLEGDLFGGWANFYGGLPSPGLFVQIVPPPSWFCECHRGSIRRLDQAA